MYPTVESIALFQSRMEGGAVATAADITVAQGFCVSPVVVDNMGFG